MCNLLSDHLYPRLLQTCKKCPGKTLAYKEPIGTCGFMLIVPFLEFEGSFHKKYSYINPQVLVKTKFPFSLHRRHPSSKRETTSCHLTSTQHFQLSTTGNEEFPVPSHHRLCPSMPNAAFQITMDLGKKSQKKVRFLSLVVDSGLMVIRLSSKI